MYRFIDDNPWKHVPLATLFICTPLKDSREKCTGKMRRARPQTALFLSLICSYVHLQSSKDLQKKNWKNEKTLASNSIVRLRGNWACYSVHGPVSTIGNTCRQMDPKKKKKRKKKEERTGWAMYDHLYKVYEKDENGTTRYTLLGSLASVPWFSTTIKIWTWQGNLEAARLTLVYLHNTQYDSANFMLLASI